MNNKVLVVRGISILGQVFLGVFIWLPVAGLMESQSSVSWNLAKVLLFGWQLLSLPLMSFYSANPRRYAPAMKIFYLFASFISLSVLLIPIGLGLILLFSLFGIYHSMSLPFLLFSGFDFLRELIDSRSVAGTNRGALPGNN